MTNYKVLEKQIYTNGAYQLIPLRQEDRDDIMKWRNEQMYHLRQATPLTEESQERYFKTVVSALFEQEQPSQILFSYLKDGKCIGYGGLVHINWIDKNAEVSFIMNTELEKEDFELHWSSYLTMLDDVAFEELNLHKLFTYAFDLRPHLYKAIEKCGYKKEATLKEHCLFNGEYKDVIIHSKIKQPDITYRLATEEDVKLLFEWTNDDTVREQSFQQAIIPYTEHKKWLGQQLENSNSIILIFFVSKSPIGQVRIEKKVDENIIGISIAKEQRGNNFAMQILILALKNFWKNSNKDITALIKATNKSSINSFLKAGFILDETSKDNDIFTYKAKKGNE